MANDKRQIEYVATNDLIPYARNSRTHSDEQVAQIAASIKEFGFTNPVLIDDENGIIAGHGRVMASQRLKLESVPCIRLSGLSEAQRKAYVIADNKLALNAGWDEELLKIELQELDEMGFDLELTGFTLDELGDLEVDVDEQSDDDSDNRYTMKVDAPTYEPKNEKPEISKLYDAEKTNQLLDAIHKSNVDEETKRFLMIAAQRHTVFNFGLIADFYAHSTKEVQELMEQSALVIIDFDDAISNGYVVLQKEFAETYAEEYDEND